jgi:hypothetical protein
MTIRYIVVSSAMFSLMLGACGGTSGDDLGSGSGTLEVRVDVEADNVSDNPTEADFFDTDFTIRVNRNGIPVPDAEVVVSSSGGPVVLSFVGDRYVGSQSGYFRTYSVDVTAGDDFLRGVQVRGPDIHHFTQPTGNEAVDVSQGLAVEWDRSEAADSARIELSNTDVAIEDTGLFEVPLSGIDCDTSSVSEEEVRLWRERRVVPNGVVGSSSFSVSVRNEHGFVVLPNPGC